MVAQGQLPSVTDPTAITLSGVYAEAALGLIDTNAGAEGICEELNAIVELMDHVEGSAELLTASLISRDERQRLVQRVFQGRCSEEVLALLGVMARNERLSLLREVARQFRRMLNVREGKVEVAVTTAVELDGPGRDRLVAMLGEALGAEPLLKTEVDGALVGGAVVKVGDRVFDASIAAELKRLRQSIMEKQAS
jgi:F-type H+-transporting ATPase subunit delta